MLLDLLPTFDESGVIEINLIDRILLHVFCPNKIINISNKKEES